VRIVRRQFALIMKGWSRVSSRHRFLGIEMIDGG
jgi:hypothetical protein